MTRNQGRKLSLPGLERETGVPGRTIRYYIARGLLDGPVNLGRGAFYHDGHVEQLKQIVALKHQGHTLSEIRVISSAGFVPEELPEPEKWWSYRIAPDCKVEIRADASPWRIRTIRNLLRGLLDRLKEEDQEDEHR